MTPDEALAAAQAAGIHRLQIPTPFAVGRVNCYLLDDEPLTLVDTGPNSGKALNDLELGLGELGRSIEDLELVIVTHQHIDHLGLVEVIAKRSGAEVAALGIAARRLANFSDDAELDDAFSADLMLRSGIPENVVVALRGVSRSFRAWGSHAYVTRPLADGEVLEFRDRRLQALHRPGHSPTDTVFWDADSQILIAADHLIAHISSNPLITRGLDGGDQRTQALVAYLDSLAKTREMPARIVLPGHGEPITDHVALIDSRMRLTQRRRAKILALIEERPRTGHEIAQALWGDVAVTQAFLTLSEVIGHTDLLINEGAVREEESEGVIIYQATGAGAIGQD